jgi:rod shape-determining protein MreC
MIKEVYGQDAVGFDWTHPDFRASAVSVDGQTYGIVEPRVGPGKEPMLSLTSTALHTVPRRGTLIVTSGSGGTYPRGIPIGEVVGAQSDASSWQRIYLIRPLVSPDEMSHVLVLGTPRNTTTDQDLASAWGIRLRQGPPPDSLLLPRAPAAQPAVAGARPTQPRPSGARLLGRAVQPQIQNSQPAGQRGPRLLGTPVPPQPDTTRRRR